MFETGKRWRVPYLIYLLALIMLAEIAFNGEAPPQANEPLKIPCPLLLWQSQRVRLTPREAGALRSAAFCRLCDLVCGAEASRLRAHAEAVEPSGCREGEPALPASCQTCLVSAPVPQALGKRTQGIRDILPGAG